MVVGFILGFAMVGLLRFSAAQDGGALLAETSAIKPGAAVNLADFPGSHVRQAVADRGPLCPSGIWPMRTLA